MQINKTLIVYFFTYAYSIFSPFWEISDNQNKQLNRSNQKKNVEIKKKKERQDQERKWLKLSGEMAQCLLYFRRLTESAWNQNLNTKFSLNEQRKVIIYYSFIQRILCISHVGFLGHPMKDIESLSLKGLQSRAGVIKVGLAACFGK